MINASFFDMLNVEEKFELNLDALKKAYYKESRKYHPDFFTMASPEEQLEASQMSELVNEAFKVLNDRRLRVQYMLRKRGLLIEGDKNELDQAFLLEMMEINEAIFDAQVDPEQWSSVMVEIKKFEDQLDLLGQQSMQDYDSGLDLDGNLQKIKEFYLKSRYLERIRENIEGIKDI